MHQWVEKLLILQNKDMRLAKLKQRIKFTPVDQAKIDALLNDAEERMKKAKAQKIEQEKLLKDLEISADSINAKMVDFQKKTIMIKNNEEYKAALAQIDKCKHQISQFEDKELVIMEAMEKLKTEFDEVQKYYHTAEKRVKEMKKDLETRVNNCKQQIDQLSKEREDAYVQVDKRIASRYTRLFQNKLKRGRDTRVIVPLRDGTICDYCHMNVTAQVKMNARKGTQVSCENCGTLVYWMD